MAPKTSIAQRLQNFSYFRSKCRFSSCLNLLKAHQKQPKPHHKQIESTLTASFEVLQIIIILNPNCGFPYFCFNVISPVIKKVFRALTFLNRISFIIILRLINVALLWCQFRCSILIGTSLFIYNRGYFDVDEKYSVKS